MTDEIHFPVDCPPLREPQISERYETVAGDKECVSLADDENHSLARERWSNLLELRVILENRLNLNERQER